MSLITTSKQEHSSAKPVSESRAILVPTGNRVRVSEHKNEEWKNPHRHRKQLPKISESVVRNNVSVDSVCSSDSCSSGGRSVKMASSGRKVKKNSFIKPVKIVPDGTEVAALSTKLTSPIKRCDWITPNSDPLYSAFHDEEWGVPAYEDRKLFESLVLSEALAELSWPEILNQRSIFRMFFENFDISSVAVFTEKKIQTLTISGTLLLSEQKLRAIVENAKQVLKVQQEFGSFSNYCWRFVNHKPIKNAFRYARQVPAKTPKAELISKDLMRRGFRCVGPTVVYSFMQVAGLVNDHLHLCFRYNECDAVTLKDLKSETVGKGVESKGLENTCLCVD